MDLKLKNNSTLILNSLPSALVNRCETIYISNCPNVNAISLLRLCNNLTNVNCTIGNVSGTLAELQHYATLHGFNNHEEPDNTVAPTINGTFTITDWYTTDELQALQGIITGLTIVADSSKNIDTALINGDFAIQILDSTQPNYNPAAAIRLQANGYGITRSVSSTATKGNWFITKDEVASITSLEKTIFGGIASAVDSNKIVSNDDTEEYLFTSFDEFKYFTGMTSIPNGANSSPRNIFAECSNLQSITLPEGITTIGTYVFFGLSNLTRLTLPSTITYMRDYNFASSGYTPNLHTVYFNGTLKQWMSFTRHANDSSANPCICGADLYIQGELLENLVIPEDITSIIATCFWGVRSITSIVFHQNVTSIGNRAFCNCTGLTGDLVIPESVTSIGNYAFDGCSGLTGVLDIKNTNLGNGSFRNCTNLQGISVNDVPARALENCSGLVNVTIYGNSHPEAALGGGNGTGTLTFMQSMTVSGNVSNCGRFKNIILHGNVTSSSAYPVFSSVSSISNPGPTEVLRIKGYYNGINGNLTYQPYSYSFKFLEIEETFNRNIFINVGYTYNGFIEHFGYNGIAGTAADAQVSSARCAKVYVGDGTSRPSDEAVLALYTNDTTNGWSSYASKLATWYDYNGQYKWYYVTDNLTNCTNTNPDAWPHITRGELYQTTIVPNEGMTLDSVTVEMYEAVDNGTTPSTPTDITSQVYNSSTGEINIPAVTGNVIITASAS